jgi:hypothetical protein
MCKVPNTSKKGGGEEREGRKEKRKEKGKRIVRNFHSSYKPILKVFSS